MPKPTQPPAARSHTPRHHVAIPKGIVLEPISDDALADAPDIDNPDDWEIVHDGEDTKVRFEYVVTLNDEETALTVRAESVDPVDWIEVAREAIISKAQAILAKREH